MSTFTETRDETVATESRPTQPAGPKGNRFLVVLVVVLAAAVVGLGAWLIIDQTSSSDTATTDDVQQLVDDYHAAWNNHDGDAYLELVTDNAVFVTTSGSTSAAMQAVVIDRSGASNWRAEPIGEPIMTGDGPWYVAQANRLTADQYPDDGYEGLSILTIVDDGGTPLVARHEYVGEY